MICYSLLSRFENAMKLCASEVYTWVINSPWDVVKPLYMHIAGGIIYTLVLTYIYIWDCFNVALISSHNDLGYGYLGLLSILDYSQIHHLCTYAAFLFSILLHIRMWILAHCSFFSYVFRNTLPRECPICRNFILAIWWFMKALDQYCFIILQELFTMFSSKTHLVIYN